VIRAVLWDFGGVLLSSPFEGFAAYEQRTGLPPGTIRRLNATDPDTNAWARFERNEIDVDGFRGAFEAEAAALGHAVDANEILAALRGELRPPMVEALRRCTAAHRTALLTNNVVSTGREGRGRSAVDEVLGLFDVVVESSKVGMRKPEEGFYRLACALLEVEPSECVFLDDLGVNLKPARAMGMETIKVVDPDVAIGELEAILGIPLR
jgi:putative hydrolase of the HAD superfamily